MPARFVLSSFLAAGLAGAACGQGPKPADPPVVQTLLAGTDAEAAFAARDLAAKAAPADVVAALVDRAFDAKTQARALDALAVVAPKLFEPVKALATQRAITSRERAIEALEKLGPAAAPALPAVVREADRTLDELTGGQAGDNLLGEIVYTQVYRGAVQLVGLHGDGRAALPALVRHATHGVKAGKTTLTPDQERFLFGGDPFSAAWGGPTRLGAVVALGRLGQREPALRAKVVDALLDLVATDSTVRQEHAILALPLCGTEAARALPKVKALRYAAAEGVQRAVAATVAEVEGRVAAAKAAGDGTDLAAVLPLLAEKFNSPAHRHALDVIAQKHPDLYPLAALLFRDQVAPGHYAAVAKELKAFEAAKPDPRRAALLAAHQKYLQSGPARLVAAGDSFEAQVTAMEGGEAHKAAYLNLIAVQDRVLEASAGKADPAVRQAVAACEAVLDKATFARKHPGYGTIEEEAYDKRVKAVQTELFEHTAKAGREKALAYVLGRGHKLLLKLTPLGALSFDTEGDRYELYFLLRVLAAWAEKDKASHPAIAAGLAAMAAEPRFVGGISSAFVQLPSQFQYTWGVCGEDADKHVQALRAKSNDEYLNEWLDETRREFARVRRPKFILR